MKLEKQQQIERQNLMKQQIREQILDRKKIHEEMKKINSLENKYLRQNYRIQNRLKDQEEISLIDRHKKLEKQVDLANRNRNSRIIGSYFVTYFD